MSGCPGELRASPSHPAALADYGPDFSKANRTQASSAPITGIATFASGVARVLGECRPISS